MLALKNNWSKSYTIDATRIAVREKVAIETKNSQSLGNKFEIELKPQFIDPFAARGRIVINILDTEIDKTKVEFEVTSGLNSKKMFLTLSVFLVPWTLFSLVYFFSTNILMMIAIGWIAMFTVIYISLAFNRAKLDDCVHC